MPAITALPTANRFRSASRRINQFGIRRWLFEAWRRRVVLPAMRWSHCPLDRSHEILRLFDGGRGLEIGGPSPFFGRGRQLPVYERVAALDNCNFASATVWEGDISEGTFETAGRALGTQFICEASDVAKRLAGRSYEFVISSNCLEHVANPLAVIEAWLAVLAPGGTLVVVPNQKSNFDHKRPVTTFDHLLADDRRGVGEDDATHFDEVLRLTDLDLTSRTHVPDAETFRRTVQRNIENRCVHHHVFDAALLARIAAHFGLDLMRVADVTTDLVLVARKPDPQSETPIAWPAAEC